MARVLLTGATGFLGRAALGALVGEGHEVRAMVRASSNDDRVARLKTSAVSIVLGDLSELSSLAHVAEGCDAVVHLGALVAPSWVDDERAVDLVNRAATIALAAHARAAGCRRFVFVSSIAAMGAGSGLSTIDAPCAPTTAYGRSKLAAERALGEMAREDFAVIALRPPTIYGPGERYNFLSLVRAVDRGVFRLIGRGDNVMPLCTDDNCARAIVAAVAGALPSGVYLVADHAHYPMRRVHRAIAAALKIPVPKTHIPEALARVVGFLNERVSEKIPAVPRILSSSRVDTLTADRPFDVSPLLARGVPLDAPLEAHVQTTIDEYRRAAVLRG